MRWYVDGVLFYTRTSAQWYTDAAPGNPQAPFDQDFYIILNAAIGGNYTGCTNPGCITATLPQQFLVDYVTGIRRYTERRTHCFHNIARLRQHPSRGRHHDRRDRFRYGRLYRDRRVL